ncbi:MAG: hypothetical protein JSR58_03140 [Verrucomicrobia bacterium]|nr:hypothetical protein [Verrucomicrobiota bacterium]
MSLWGTRAVVVVVCIVGVTYAAKKAWDYFTRQMISDPDDEPVLPKKIYPKELATFPFRNVVPLNEKPIPDDVILHIFSFLELSDAIKFSSTCKSLAFYRTDTRCKAFAIFRLIRLQAEIPFDRTAIYAQFYKNKLWGIYLNAKQTNKTIRMYECLASTLEKKVDAEIILHISREKTKPFLHITRIADGILVGSVNEAGFLFYEIVYDYPSWRLCLSVTNEGKISSHPSMQVSGPTMSVCAGPGSVSYRGEEYRCTIWEGETYKGDFNVSTPGGLFSAVPVTIGMQLLSDNKLLTVTWLGLCKVWDIKDPLIPEVIRTFSMNTFLNDTLNSERRIPWAAVVGSKEQWLIWYNDRKGTCEIWDFQKGWGLFSIPLKEHFVNCHLVIEDRYLLLGLKKGTNSIYIYDLLLGKHIVTYKHDMPILDFRYDGSKLWVVGDKKTMIIG